MTSSPVTAPHPPDALNGPLPSPGGRPQEPVLRLVRDLVTHPVLAAPGSRPRPSPCGRATYQASPRTRNPSTAPSGMWLLTKVVPRTANCSPPPRMSRLKTPHSLCSPARCPRRTADLAAPDTGFASSVGGGGQPGAPSCQGGLTGKRVWRRGHPELGCGLHPPTGIPGRSEFDGTARGRLRRQAGTGCPRP